MVAVKTVSFKPPLMFLLQLVNFLNINTGGFSSIKPKVPYFSEEQGFVSKSQPVCVRTSLTPCPDSYNVLLET